MTDEEAKAITLASISIRSTAYIEKSYRRLGPRRGLRKLWMVRFGGPKRSMKKFFKKKMTAVNWCWRNGFSVIELIW